MYRTCTDSPRSRNGNRNRSPRRSKAKASGTRLGLCYTKEKINIFSIWMPSWVGMTTHLHSGLVHRIFMNYECAPSIHRAIIETLSMKLKSTVKTKRPPLFQANKQPICERLTLIEFSRVRLMERVLDFQRYGLVLIVYSNVCSEGASIRHDFRKNSKFPISISIINFDLCKLTRRRSRPHVCLHPAFPS